MAKVTSHPDESDASDGSDQVEPDEEKEESDRGDQSEFDDEAPPEENLFTSDDENDVDNGVDEELAGVWAENASGRDEMDEIK